MTSELKLGRQEKSSNASAKVVVAVKASNEVPKTALVWALTHVVQPGDCIILLVVVPSQSSGIFPALFCLSYIVYTCALGNALNCFVTILFSPTELF